MKSKLLAAATAALGLTLALSATTASAGLINNYDFNGNNGNLGNTATFAGSMAGGPALKASGYAMSTGTNPSWIRAEVRRAGDALGVNAGQDDGNAGQIGGRVEGILFDLGAVFFGSFKVNFSLFDGADNADIWASTTIGNPNNFTAASRIANDSTTNPFSSGPLNFRYIFVANDNSPNNGGCIGNDSNCFRIDNLQVIPEPGSLALVGAALLLAGAVRRRRNAA